MIQSEICRVILKRIEWVIWLCHADLGSLTDGGWLKLKEELYDYFTVDIEWSFASGRKSLTKDDITALADLIETSETRFPDGWDDTGDVFEPEAVLDYVH